MNMDFEGLVGYVVLINKGGQGIPPNLCDCYDIESSFHVQGYDDTHGMP